MSATGSLILDSSVRGILDTNTLYGTAENVSATGSSNLDGLLALSTALVTNPQIAEASLGAITSIASSDVTHFAQGTTSLGVVSSNAGLVVSKSMTAQALLESLSSEAFLGIVLDAVGESNLGGLSAAGTAQGGEPPAPPEPQYGSRGYVRHKVKPKLEPVYEPEIPVIVETKKPIKILILKPDTVSSNFNASAQNRIDFSIVQDEADLLLIL
jgi:hypothetical protein